MQMNHEYPYAWAWKVYDAFTEAYPRATEISLIMLGIDAKLPVQALAKRHEFWERWKRLVKSVDHHLQVTKNLGPLERPSERWMGVLLEWAVKRDLLHKCEVLTNRIKELRLSEHVSTGGTPEAIAEGVPPTSSSSGRKVAEHDRVEAGTI